MPNFNSIGSGVSEPQVAENRYLPLTGGIALTTVYALTCYTVITALHGMQTRSSDENSVCLSVRLSVTRVYCDKTVERSVQIFIPYERTFSLVF